MEEKESFQQQVFLMMKEVIGEKNTIAVPRLFCKAMGDLSGGVFLSQLVYWCDKGSRKDGFIYKTAKEWTEETFLSSYEINKARKKLEADGILETKLKKANGNPTIHYKLLQKPFVDWLFKFFNKESEIIDNGKLNFEDSLTKTTSKTTSKINKDKASFKSNDGMYFVDKFSTEALTVYRYFINSYLNNIGQVHPTINQAVVDKLNSIMETGYINDPEYDKELYIDIEAMESMIDKYFITHYELRDGGQADYRIYHFLSDMVLKNLYYKECY